MKSKKPPRGRGESNVGGVAVRFRCFCGREAGAGYMADGTPIVTHAEPACTQFIELEADEYLARINRRNSN